MGLESQRLDYQGIDVRLGTITEQLAEQQVELQSVIEGLPEGADESRGRQASPQLAIVFSGLARSTLQPLMSLRFSQSVRRI